MSCIAALAETCEQSGVLEHPFLHGFRESFNRDQVAEWSKEQAHLSRTLSTVIAGCVARTPVHFVAERAACADMLHDEIWRPNQRRGHGGFFRTLWCDLHGEDVNEEHLPEPIEATRVFVEARDSLGLGDLLTCCGALAANEYLNSHRDGSGQQQGFMVDYMAGLQRLGLDVRYARAHVFGEDSDTERIIAIAERVMREGIRDAEVALREFSTGVQQYCQARQEWFDGLLKAIA